MARSDQSARRVLVTGAGGFVGGHLAAALIQRGAEVRAVDHKPPERWYQTHAAAESIQLDLSRREACEQAVDGIDTVFSLASDMGGMGFIAGHKAACMLSVLIDTHMLASAREAGVGRYFYASSACVYANYRQTSAELEPLREADAYPADPEDGYGWEKLFTERMCRHFAEDFGFETRVARYHNVYGPNGAWSGGREKAPSAICRKVAEAVIDGGGEIEIWGDGKQSRSFTFIDDCVRGTIEIAEGPPVEPINLGSAELVTIDGLVSIVEEIAGAKLRRNYNLDAPQGVRGRNSDNTLFRETYDWEPSTPLREGMARTYEWIYDEVAAQRSGKAR